MPAYNPHDTLDVITFREVEAAIGKRRATRLFDFVRLERSLKRLSLLADTIAGAEHSADVAELLALVREFGEVSNVVDVLTATAHALHDVEPEPTDGCIACALSAGGVCQRHAAAPSR